MDTEGSGLSGQSDTKGKNMAVLVRSSAETFLPPFVSLVLGSILGNRNSVHFHG